MLEALATGGEAGLLASEVAASFDAPASAQRRASWCGTELRRHERRGLARRLTRETRPGAYHNATSLRWQLTPAGRDWLRLGPEAARLRSPAARAAAVARAARARAAAEALTGWESELRGGCRARRDAAVRACAAAGASVRQVSDATGLSYERVRQLLTVRQSPCCCPRCARDAP